MRIKIKIIGDIMLDEWIYGSATKKSAEAPINIFETMRVQSSLGGVGNLCINLKSLGINFDLISEIGNDKNGNKIIKILKQNKINNKILKTKKITTIKKRFYINNLQIFRQDIENIKINKNINSKLKKIISKKDIVVLSDYKKGLINEKLINILNKKKCITFVDPKNKPHFYKNAFLVKPNMEKFEEWCGKFSKIKAFNLLKSMNWEWLVISNNKFGVHVFNKNSEYNFYKVKTCKLPNVVGAGDIFFSGIIYNYLKNLDIFTSTEFASFAASKCIAKEKIRKIKVKDFKKKIVFTNGVFDVLHKGHEDLLKFCRKIGTKVILGINSDKSVKLNKGPKRPINKLSIRIKNIKKKI